MTEHSACNESERPTEAKACRVHAFGGPDVIRQEEVLIPMPAAGEVLLRVAAAGVGPWDGWIRAGKSALPQPLPLTLGSDLSGEVMAVGAGVTGLEPGDAVFGVTNPQFTGAYATHAIASAAMLARRPSGLACIDAAALPVIAATAWQALFDEAHLSAGATVLIHGGAGSVGALAVQFARRAGLRVIATAGASDLAFVTRLGAAAVVDYRSERFEDVAKDVDAVVDLVGGHTQTRSFAVLKPGGVLVSAVSPPDRRLAERYGVRATFFLVEVTTARLEALAPLFSAGEVAAEIGTVLPLADARMAHEMLDGIRQRPRGKIVLKP